MRFKRVRHHVQSRYHRKRFIRNGHAKIRYTNNKYNAFGYDRANYKDNNRRLITGSYFDMDRFSW